MPSRTDPEEIAFLDEKIRCVLAHDHVLLRQGLRRMLDDEPDIAIVSEAGNAAECLRKVHELRPDVVIAGADMFGLPSPEAQLLVADESLRTKLVFVSTHEQSSPRLGDPQVANATCAVRQTSAEELVEMVRSSCGVNRANGRTESAGYHREHSPEGRFTPQPLTAREREVMKLLAEGKTVRASAAVLGLSVKTVDAHKFNLMRKLGVHNKAELVISAIQKRIVKVPVNF